MTFTYLGNFGTGYSSHFNSPSPKTIPINVPAAIPAGSHVLAFGINVLTSSGSVLSSVIDSKGNPYTVRSATGLILADSLHIPTALASGDTITYNFSGPVEPGVSLTGAYWSSDADKRVYFQAAAGATWPPFPTAGNLNATGGQITTVLPGELILGIFGQDRAHATTWSRIDVPGAGYTDPTPSASVSGAAPANVDGAHAMMCDFETKIGSAPGNETATATLKYVTDRTNAQYGLTAAYMEVLPNQMMGVV